MCVSRFVAHTGVGLLLLGLAACRPLLGDSSNLDPTPPLPSSAIVLTRIHQYQGYGCLVDREHRLLLTSAETLGGTLREAEAIFPVYEDGKIKPRRDYYLKQAPHVPGTVVETDIKHDLALLQLESVPDDSQPLTIAKSSPKENDKVLLLVDPGGKSQAWFQRSSTVRSVGDQVLTAPSTTRVIARMIETALDSKLGKAAGGAAMVNETGELVGIVTSASIAKSSLCAIDVDEIRPFLADAYRKLAEAAIKKKEYTQALALCDKALVLRPEDGFTYNERGAALSWLNRYDEAIAEYGKALQRDPTLFKAYRNRASVYLHQGKVDEAIADCNAAIKLNKKYVAAYVTRRDAYRKLNKPDLAKADQEAIDELTKPKVND
jgi:Flp pilus assembly protein TadD